MIPKIRYEEKEKLKARVMARSQLTNDEVTAKVKDIIAGSPWGRRSRP